MSLLFADKRVFRGQRKRGERIFFTTYARKVVSDWYTKNRDYPYPTEDEVIQMAAEASISTSQVIKWLANKRLRTNNTMKTSGVMHPKRRQKMLLIEEAKVNPAAAARRAAAQKNRRYFLKESAVNVLKRWYNDHKEHPYPTEAEKESLALEGDIKVCQVTCWFANKRNRCRKTKQSPEMTTDMKSNEDIEQTRNNDQNSENNQNQDNNLKQENNVPHRKKSLTDCLDTIDLKRELEN